MNVQDAFYNTVHKAEGGCEALAARMGMSAAILRNKANPNTASNTPTLLDADRIMGLTRDYSILDALAANHGRVVVPMPDDYEASDMSVLEMVARIMGTNGNVGNEIFQALQDGKVSRAEVDKVREAARNAQRAIEEAVARLDRMAE